MDLSVYTNEWNRWRTQEGGQDSFEVWLARHLARNPNDPGPVEYNRDGTLKQLPAGTNPYSPTGTNVDRVDPGTGQPINPIQQAAGNSLYQGAVRAGAGGNTNQVQGGFQSGQFATQGTQESNQTSGQTQVSNQTQSQQGTQTNSQVGQTTQAQQSQQGQNTNQTTSGQSQQQTQQNTAQQGVTQGTSTAASDQSTTRNVNDTLGFGALLAGQGAGAVAADNQRNAFLTNVMNTGGTGFQQQLQAGINQSLSGPGMTGVGVGAQGRVAGAAAADIGRNNLNQRLQAAQQLTSGGQTASLAGASTPFLGTTDTTKGVQTGTNAQTTANTGTSTGSTLSSTLENLAGNTSGWSNLLNQGTQASSGSTASSNTGTSAGTTSQTGFQNLLSNESQGGTSNAQSTQVATGQIPEGKTTSSGGCVVCTTYSHLGLMHRGAIRRAVTWKVANAARFGTSGDGYMVYGPLLVKLVLISHLFRRLWRPLARLTLYEECRLAANKRRHKFRLDAWVLHGVFHYGSHLLGLIVKRPLTDATTIGILKAQKLFFTWRS